MAFPLIALGIGLGSLALHQSTKRHYSKLESERYHAFKSSDKARVIKPPSDIYSSHIEVTPSAGAIVCCEVYGVLEHTGIWIDSDTIIELSNNGLVKSVSSQRFLNERSGERIYVACDHKHKPIIIDSAADRAISQIFTYRQYDVLKNNCHRFTHYCLTGDDIEISQFSSLNSKLLTLTNHDIYWDRVKT